MRGNKAGKGQRVVVFEQNPSKEETFTCMGEIISEATTNVPKERMYLMSLRSFKEAKVAGAE